jgi:putative nucleotidyltransferase with HDIG domain
MIQSGVLETVERLDATTYNHSVRVKELCQQMEAKLGRKDTILSDAALVHDIGKFYISGNILDKHAPLTATERNIVNLHPYIGFQMLQEYHVDPAVCAVVLFHHTDEPPTLSFILPEKSEDILQVAHILRTVDAYEALTTDRPYRRRMSAKEAIAVMCKDKTYDAAIMDMLLDTEG